MSTPNLIVPNGGMSNNELADVQAQNASTLATSWHEGIGTVDVDPATRKILNEASQSIVKAAAALRASEQEATGWENNLDLHPDGRKQRANDARQAGIDTANEALKDAATFADISETLLIDESAPLLPENPARREAAVATARQDIQMVLNGEKSNTNLMQRVRILAERDDAISNVVTTGDWLDLYLMSRGVDDSDRALIVKAAKEYAVVARANRGNVPAQLVHKLRRNMRAGIYASRSVSRRQ